MGCLLWSVIVAFPGHSHMFLISYEKVSSKISWSYSDQLIRPKRSGVEWDFTIFERMIASKFIR